MIVKLHVASLAGKKTTITNVRSVRSTEALDAKRPSMMSGSMHAIVTMIAMRIATTTLSTSIRNVIPMAVVTIARTTDDI
jgi:hypothetical protein